MSIISPHARKALSDVISECLQNLDGENGILAALTEPPNEPEKVIDARRRLNRSVAALKHLVSENGVSEALVLVSRLASPDWNIAPPPGPEGAAVWQTWVKDAVRQARSDLELIKEAANPAPPRKRHRSPPRHPVELTDKQLDAVYLVGEHNGNYTAAARAAGKSRAALVKLFKKAEKKLGKKAVEKLQTQPLPTDPRGQIDVAEEE